MGQGSLKHKAIRYGGCAPPWRAEAMKWVNPYGFLISEYGKKAVKTAHRQKVSPKPTQLPPIRLPGVRTFGQGQLAQTERDKALTLLWQPFSQRRQRELNRENSRVYRVRYGSKSELQVQRISTGIPPLFSTKIVIDSCFLFPEGTELALSFRATYPVCEWARPTDPLCSIGEGSARLVS